MPSLLLVDDDSAIRTLFARALQGRGDIDQAGGGGEALRLLGAKKYDLVLLDLHMPVIDGWVVLQMLATKPGPNRDTPVFVVTADTSDRARVEALRRKAVFFLTKPVNLATLTSLIEGALKLGAAKSQKPPAPTGAPPRLGSQPFIDPTDPDRSKKRG
ncbi:MAG TPA: response regulator [Minicystis sp.]|nr:response regulator [Minicystis sp.]